LYLLEVTIQVPKNVVQLHLMNQK